MVRCNGIQRIVLQPLNNGLPILHKAQGRIHFGIGPAFAHSIVSQGKIVRCCFRRDVDTALFGLAYGLNRLPGAHMGDVQGRPREFTQGNVAHYHDALGCIGNAFVPQFPGHPALVHAASGSQF